MKPHTTVTIGAFLGTFWGILLYAFTEAFRMASFVLYGDAYKIAIVANCITFAIIIPVLLTYTIWVPWCYEIAEYIIEDFRQGKEFD